MLFSQALQTGNGLSWLENFLHFNLLKANLHLHEKKTETVWSRLLTDYAVS